MARIENSSDGLLTSVRDNFRVMDADDSSCYLQQQLRIPGPRVAAIEAATLAGAVNALGVFPATGRPNEDAFAVRRLGQSLYLSVFDGSTSLDSIREVEALGVTPARFASHYLATGVITNQQELSAQELLLLLNAELLSWSREMLPRIDLTNPYSTPMSTGVITQLNFDKRVLEVAAVGDTFVIVRFKSGGHRLLTVNDLASHEQAVFDHMVEIARQERISNKEARNRPEIVSELLSMLRSVLNRPDGLGAGSVNGNPDMALYTQRYSIPLDEVRDIFVGSDGSIPPGWSEEAFGTTRQPGREDIFATLDQGGLKGLFDLKKSIEDSDPNWHNPRWKHSDDATGIWVKLS